jgi:hypothetical protein
MIKATAVAGAAAWTAPMIIDSLSSPAAAASGGGSVTCSKDLVFFTIPGNPQVYIAGYQNSCAGCNCFGTFSAPNLSPSGFRCYPCGGVTYRVNVGSANAATGATCATATTAAPQLPVPSTCTQWLSVSGGTVTGINGATVLAAIAFEGNVVYGFCPSSNTIAFGNCIGGATASV